MNRRWSNFDDLVRYVHGGKIRFSGCNARKQRARFEELSTSPEQQRELRLGWKRWEAIKEACMCHTGDGVIRRLYEFFSCFEGSYNTQNYLHELDCILERRGADYQQKVTHARRVLDRVCPEYNNIVDDVVQDIERNARPTLFWFLLKTPNANEQEIMAAYKQFAFSKTTTKLVAPLFLWMWRVIETLVQDRLQLLQIVYEVVTCTYNQKTVTHLVPMKLLKDSKRVTKELRRVLALRAFVTDPSSYKFPEDIDDILSAEISELKRNQQEDERAMKRDQVKREQVLDEDEDVLLVNEEEEKEMVPSDPYCGQGGPMPEYAEYHDQYFDVDAFDPRHEVQDQLPWLEFPDLDDVDYSHNGMPQPPSFEYAQDFGNVPYMLENDARVQRMAKKEYPQDDILPNEEEKHALVTGVPVRTYGAPAPTEDAIHATFQPAFMMNNFPPPPRVPVSAVGNANVFPPRVFEMDDDEDVEMTPQTPRDPAVEPFGSFFGRLTPPVSAIGTFGSNQQWNRQMELPPPPPPIEPQEDLYHRYQGYSPPFGSSAIPPPVVVRLEFDESQRAAPYPDPNVSSVWSSQFASESVPQFKNEAFNPFGGTNENTAASAFRNTGAQFASQQDTATWDDQASFSTMSTPMTGPVNGNENADGRPGIPPPPEEFSLHFASGVDGIGLPFGFGSNHCDVKGSPSHHSSLDQSGFGTEFAAPPHPQAMAFGGTQFGSMTAPNFNSFAWNGGFSFGNGYMGQAIAGDPQNGMLLDSGHMELDFMDPPMEVDVPPPENRRLNPLEHNDSSFVLQDGAAINSGGSRQNDPFDLNQENPPSLSRHGQTFF